MKKYFMTGFVILLPLLLTVMIIGFVINFLTRPFLEPTIQLISPLTWIQSSFLLILLSKLFILACLVGVILLVGSIGQLFLVKKAFSVGDQLVHSLPYINRIYKAFQDVIHTFFSTSSTSYSQVVLVPFPNPESLSIGLITNEGGIGIPTPEGKELVCVYLPSDPNPTYGYLLFFKKDQLIGLDMKVEEAMRCVVSCGIVMPEFSLLKKDDEKKINQSDLL